MLQETMARAAWAHPALAGERKGEGVNGGHQQLWPAGIDDIDVEALRRRLESTVRGDVLFDSGHRAAYSHDSSNYRQPPLGIVCPRDTEDLVAAVAAAREHGAPVLPRGCGTCLSGATCNVAVVIDTSKYMREVVEVDPDASTARVQAGCIRDHLSHPCEAEHGLTFAPDTATHACATFGGMIGSNACGIHSITAGRTSDNVEELDVLLYDGTRLTVGVNEEERLDEIVAAGGRRGEIYARLRELRDRYADRIRERYPDIPRRVSGYNLDELLPERGLNVARALTGTEGTCVTVLEARLRLIHSPPHRTLLVLGYDSIFAAADQTSELMEHGPTGLEAIDGALIEDLVASRRHPGALELVPDGTAFLFVEFGGDRQRESDGTARRCLEAVSGAAGGPVASRLVNDPAEARRLWRLRESALGAASHSPEGGDHWPGWEDAAVPPGTEGDYLRDFHGLLDRHGYRAKVYGHFGQGCIHCRISFDLRTHEGIARWRRFLDEAADLVVSYGGSLSGEHGDGQQRAELLPKMYGDELVEAFREFKAIWDPDGRMNPHKVVEPYPIVSNLRLGSEYSPAEPEVHFAYPDDGGSFAHAALRCVGAGACRETSTGTMCPSYMVTLDEQHSTRGRARILYEMLQGDTIGEGFRSDEVREALDLCVSCKGCKGDCPVSVDMATYKAEFLSKYFKGRPRPPQAYSLGLVMLHARIAQCAPRLANRVTRAAVLGDLTKRAGGISPKRDVPPFALETFKAWWKRRTPVNPTADPVVLFPDTFGNFFHPEPMKATAEVLEDAGYRVIVPPEALCCGRPLYDYGMLATAKGFWARVLEVLRPHVRAGTKLVGVEPSCVAAFRDELPGLLPHDEDAMRLSRQTLTLGEFLIGVGYEAPRLERRALVHGHCHQEAVIGTSAERQLLEGMGLGVEVLDSGCCGMAGAFGFEKGHYDTSVAIGEHRLCPWSATRAGRRS